MANKAKKNTKNGGTTKKMKTEELNMSDNHIGTENNKSNATHVSFMECFPSGWRDYFRKEDVLLKIVQAEGLAQTHDLVKLNTTYLVDDNRITLIVLLRKKGTEILDKLIIDVISGYIEFEQLMDVLYVIGSDADYRIILYDNNVQDRGRDSIVTILPPLMKEMAGCVFLTFMGIDLELCDEDAVNFQCVDRQAIVKKGKRKLPERRHFENLEFWVSYFLPVLCRDKRIESNLWFSDEDDETEDRIRPTQHWDEDRMITSCSINKKDLRWLLTNKLEEMKAFFEGCTIELELETWQPITKEVHKEHVPLCDVLDKLDDKKYKLIEGRMTICRPMPFRNFIYSLPSEKESLAEQFASVSLYLEGLIPDPGAKNSHPLNK